jgi:hypothetical protein
MSNIDFLHHLKENAYANLKQTIFNDYVIDLQGWKSNNFDTVFKNILTDVGQEFSSELTIFELGSWKGLTSSIMANISKSNNIRCKIICIDTWLGSPDYLTSGLFNINQGLSLKIRNGYPSVYYTFLNNIYNLHLDDIIIPFAMSSNEASNVLEFYDIKAHIIFIDNSHDYSSIKINVNKFWNLLQINGCIFGDNYNSIDIKQAIDEFANSVNVHIVLNENIWILKKTMTNL